jgi:hypothetical protein
MFTLSYETPPLVLGADMFWVPPDHLTGWSVSAVRALCAVPGPTVGTVTFGVTLDGVSALSTNITIDPGETSSATAAVPPVINPATSTFTGAGKLRVFRIGSGGGDVYWAQIIITLEAP